MLDVLATMKKMTKAEGSKDRVPKKPPVNTAPTDTARMARAKPAGSTADWQRGHVATIDAGKRTKQPPTHDTPSASTTGKK